MAQRQSYSSPPPYVVSSPGLHYDDSVSNNVHGWTYHGSGNTYQQPWVQYPNTEQSAPPLYPAQNQNNFVQQQHVAQRTRLCVIPRKNTPIPRQHQY